MTATSMSVNISNADSGMIGCSVEHCVRRVLRKAAMDGMRVTRARLHPENWQYLLDALESRGASVARFKWEGDGPPVLELCYFGEVIRVDPDPTILIDYVSLDA